MRWRDPVGWPKLEMMGRGNRVFTLLSYWILGFPAERLPWSIFFSFFKIIWALLKAQPKWCEIKRDNPQPPPTYCICKHTWSILKSNGIPDRMHRSEFGPRNSWSLGYIGMLPGLPWNQTLWHYYGWPQEDEDLEVEASEASEATRLLEFFPCTVIYPLVI